MEFLNINKVFANTYYAVPDYQRDYEWTNAQNSTLLDDIFNIMFNDNVTNQSPPNNLPPYPTNTK